MPSFDRGPTPAAYTPFGKNAYLRSTNPRPNFESFTVAASSVAVEVIDGSNQKILQSGEVMAKITSAAGTSTAADVGKVGPYDVNATDGRQTLANIVGINDTFLPWQLLEHDEQISCAVSGRVVQAWCIERISDVRGPLGNTTAAALVAQKTLSFLFS